MSSKFEIHSLDKLVLVLACSLIFIFALLPKALAKDKYMWNLRKIGVTKALHRKEAGQGVKVGVFDGLADPDHKETRSRIYNFTHSSGYYGSYDDHGTHVATTIAANNTGNVGMVGVAPKATIYNYGIFDDYDWVGYESYGVDLVREKGVRVINMSYGPTAKGWLFSGTTSPLTMAASKNRNIVFVKSAGNDGTKLKTTVMPNSFDASKSLANLIIVGSVDRQNRLSSFSNRPGRYGFKASNRRQKSKNKYKYFFIVAPGENIRAGTASVKYDRYSGTSMAAPHVTGAVALLQGYWPVLKNSAGATADILFKTAKDLGAEGVDNTYGWGLLQVDKALSPLGATYLSSSSKQYSFSSSRLSVSRALTKLKKMRLSFFDEYQRDFQTDVTVVERDTPGSIESWVTQDRNRQDRRRPDQNGLALMMSAQNYDPEDPDVSDLQWGVSYRANSDATMLYLGKGKGSYGLKQFDRLSFGLAADENIMSGPYPVLSLADGGLHFMMDHSLGQNWSFQGGLLSNWAPGITSEDLDYAPKAAAVTTSLMHTSSDSRFITGLTASYMTENEGMLGTSGMGGLNFTDGFDTTALTLNASYNAGYGFTFSASLTSAFSYGDGVEDSVLSADSDWITSTAFSLGVEKKNIFRGNDSLRLSVSQPLKIESGGMRLDYGAYYDENGTLYSANEHIDLESDGRQINYQLEYSVSPVKDVDMGLFTYYAQDYQHEAGRTDQGVGFRISLKFQ